MGSNSQNAGTGTLSKAYYEMLARGVLRNVGPDPREICKKEGKRKCCSEEIKYQKLVRDHFKVSASASSCPSILACYKVRSHMRYSHFILPSMDMRSNIICCSCHMYMLFAFITTSPR